MTNQEARHLMALSREARWDFPSSQGRPIRWDSQEEWVGRLVREQGRLVDAVRLLIDTGHGDMALEMAANVWRLWILSRDIAGGHLFLARVLEETEASKPSRAKALALYGDSLFAFHQGKLNESRDRNEEALKIALQVMDREAEALSRLGLSRVDFEDGDYEAALSHASTARKIADSVSPALGQAPLFIEAQSNRMLGNYEEAAKLFQESVDLNRRIQDKGMVVAELTNLGFVEVHRGDANAAELCFNESATLGESLDDPYSRAMTLVTKAGVAFLKRDKAESRTHLSEAEKILKDSGLTAGPDDKFEIDWLKAKIEKEIPVL